MDIDERQTFCPHCGQKVITTVQKKRSLSAKILDKLGGSYSAEDEIVIVNCPGCDYVGPIEDLP